MRVIFLGTPRFAVPALSRLLDSPYEVCAVVTQPDRPAGRGRKLQTSPVKTLALKHHLPLHQPEKIRDPVNRAVLEHYQPDFLVVVAFGQILPSWLLQLPRLAPVNVHASLLPRYRGAAPVQWALVKGDTCTGVTTMIMEERLDTGPMLLKLECPISPTITAGELSEQLAAMGADLLIPTLDGLRTQTLQAVRQDDRMATMAPRITKEMAPIAWESPAIRIHNQVRGLNPWPLASTTFYGQRLLIHRTSPPGGDAAGSAQPGTFRGITQDGMLIQCGEHILEVLQVQVEGRRTVSGREFANGARLRAGDLVFPPVPGAGLC